MSSASCSSPTPSSRRLVTAAGSHRCSIDGGGNVLVTSCSYVERVMNRFIAIVLTLAAVAATSAQAPPRLSFEVASVKPVAGGGEATPPGAVGPPLNGRVRYPRGSLRTL